MTSAIEPDGTPTVPDTVELRVPASPAYLAVVRTATAGLAARLNLTIDEIEDLRIAVDEACALVLDHRAHPGENLDATFTIRANMLEVMVRGPASTVLRRATFAWSVLEALAGEVETGTSNEGCWIRLTHTRSRRA